MTWNHKRTFWIFFGFFILPDSFELIYFVNPLRRTTREAGPEREREREKEWFYSFFHLLSWSRYGQAGIVEGGHHQDKLVNSARSPFTRHPPKSAASSYEEMFRLLLVAHHRLAGAWHFLELICLTWSFQPSPPSLLLWFHCYLFAHVLPGTCRLCMTIIISSKCLSICLFRSTLSLVVFSLQWRQQSSDTIFRFFLYIHPYTHAWSPLTHRKAPWKMTSKVTTIGNFSTFSSPVVIVIRCRFHLAIDLSNKKLFRPEEIVARLSWSFYFISFLSSSRSPLLFSLSPFAERQTGQVTFTTSLSSLDTLKMIVLLFRPLATIDRTDRFKDRSFMLLFFCFLSQKNESFLFIF